MATTSVSTLNEIFSFIVFEGYALWSTCTSREILLLHKSWSLSRDRSSGVKRVNINNVDLSPSKKQYCLLHPASNAYRILRIRRKMIDL